MTTLNYKLERNSIIDGYFIIPSTLVSVCVAEVTYLWKLGGAKHIEMECSDRFLRGGYKMRLNEFDDIDIYYEDKWHRVCISYSLFIKLDHSFDTGQIFYVRCWINE